MNDTTVGNVPGLAGRVAAYVREVRAELADLPLEDVDDLTGGMDADLTELAAECGGDLAGRLGSPRLYAAELRAAAGLPERVPGSGRRRGQLTEDVARARVWFKGLTEQHPGLRSVMAFLLTLRPAWWLLRGYLAAWASWSLLSSGMPGFRPHDYFQLLIALLSIVGSVQLGRGWMRQWAVVRPLVVVGNAVAVVLALVLLSAGEQTYDGAGTYSPQPGMSLDGQQVSNLYTYDSDGHRLTGVRLFGQDGRPLNGDAGQVDVSGNPMGIVRDSSGAPLLNVYPRALVGLDPWQVTDPANPEANPGQWTPPVSIVPLTLSTPATPTEPTSTAPAPTPMATPKPTATPPASATGPTPRSTSNAVPSKSASPAPTVAH